jgi:hypothetical protein
LVISSFLTFWSYPGDGSDAIPIEFDESDELGEAEESEELEEEEEQVNKK